MAYNYTFQKYEPEKMSRAVGTDLEISTKHAIEICNAIRGKKVSQATRILVDAIELKRAIPYKRFTDGVGHKPKIGAGRFTPKACKNILNILNSAVSNAEEKALDKENLIILHINSHRASRPLHYGRKRRETKRTHVEIVLGEMENQNAPKKKQIKKTEEKKEVKAEPKPAKPKSEKKVEEKSE